MAAFDFLKDSTIGLFLKNTHNEEDWEPMLKIMLPLFCMTFGRHDNPVAIAGLMNLSIIYTLKVYGLQNYVYLVLGNIHVCYC